MPIIEYQSEVFESNGGTIIIYDALYCGEPCFAIVHTPTGHTEIIDHNAGLLRAVTQKIDRSNRALTCDKKARGRILKFPARGKEHSVSLRLFVYAKYRGVSLKQVRGKNIVLDDDSAVKGDIQDLRGGNLYDAGELRPHTKRRDIQIVEHQETGEKLIAITLHSRENEKIEYTDYSPELYEMLARPTYCSIEYNDHNDRALVVVHYAHSKSGYVRENLAKFVLIYNTYFGRYRNMTGSVKRFIRDYPKLSEKHNGFHAAHVNSCKSNNCTANLLFMDQNSNMVMNSWIKQFSPPYGVFTAVNSKGEILLELSSVGFTCGGERAETFFKCRTPADFLDWQRFFLGKALTEGLQRVSYSTPNGARQALTPCGMIASGEVDRETAKANEPDIWTWLDHRDKLLSMAVEDFFTWDIITGRLVIHVPEAALDGRPFVLPFGNGAAVVKVTPLSIQK